METNKVPTNEKVTEFLEPYKDPAIKSIKSNSLNIQEGAVSFIFTQNPSDTLYAGEKLNLVIDQLGIVITKDGIRMLLYLETDLDRAYRLDCKGDIA